MDACCQGNRSQDLRVALQLHTPALPEPEVPEPEVDFDHESDHETPIKTLKATIQGFWAGER